MSAVLHLLLAVVLCLVAIPMLARAAWPARSPRTAVLLWQAIAVTLPLSVAGSLIAYGTAPHAGSRVDLLVAIAGDLASATPTRTVDAWHLLAVLGGTAIVVALPLAALLTWIPLARVRRRHRDLLDLVTSTDPAAPGAAILDHPVPVVYCVPGRRSRVVISTGALRQLDTHQVRAVLAHERAHATGRHHLVLLQFASLRRLLGTAGAQVGALLEMCADDHASRVAPRTALATALVQLSAPAPRGALGVGEHAVRERVTRLADPTAPVPLTARLLGLLTGITLIATPVSFAAYELSAWL
ncbi:Zn-dependent protease with chaperone function [Herbihabitans rhizosphaerae]|uniref:Zn-dependent protease with chaperone function n=1 Tax=Herbihabitans rhizosphaerae TaxID=1872711 RepID=A0A4Q7L3N3_9PSEU|nr:M56 family metallopeptidase [Herbihabitans rhizosphaerae]RZS44218.1 Zn-dependent protease with chaperone function [Herbihabitans rhizosphaerae]